MIYIRTLIGWLDQSGFRASWSECLAEADGVGRRVEYFLSQAVCPKAEFTAELNIPFDAAK
jgi:hypothetical protein